MPTYEIGGKTFETDGPLSDADIDHIAGSAGTTPAVPHHLLGLLQIVPALIPTLPASTPTSTSSGKTPTLTP
jgi:hypothetical protein